MKYFRLHLMLTQRTRRARRPCRTPQYPWPPCDPWL